MNVISYGYHVVLNTVHPLDSDRIKTLDEVSEISNFFVNEAPADIIPKLLSLGVHQFSLVFGENWPWMEISNGIILPNDFQLGMYKIEDWNRDLKKKLLSDNPIVLHSLCESELLEAFSKSVSGGRVARPKVLNNKSIFNPITEVLLFEIELDDRLISMTIENCYWSIEFRDRTEISCYCLESKDIVLEKIDGCIFESIDAYEDEICISLSNNYRIYMSRAADILFSESWFKLVDEKVKKVLSYNENSGFELKDSVVLNPIT